MDANKHTIKIKTNYICFLGFISVFTLLQTSKFAEDLIQGSLVKACEVEVLQSAKIFDKAPIL